MGLERPLRIDLKKEEGGEKGDWSRTRRPCSVCILNEVFERILRIKKEEEVFENNEWRKIDKENKLKIVPKIFEISKQTRPKISPALFP